MLRKLTFLCAIGIVASAHADTIATFNFNGTLQNFTNGKQNGTGSVSGTVQVATTAGLFTGADFVALVNGSRYLFDTVPSPQGPQSTPPAAYIAQFFSAAGDDFQVALPVASLVGYAGSGVCTSTAPCALRRGRVSSVLVYGTNTGDTAYDFAEVLSGSLAPASAATPEPGSLLLLGSGLLGMIGVVRRRRCC